MVERTIVAHRGRHRSTGRRCFGLEIDPKYVDTIVRRWQRYTGGQALNAKSGRSFSELEAEAEERDGK